MSDSRPPWERDRPSPAAETTTDKAEAAAIRRRWITLGELLAVAGVVISALALWNSWAERREAETEKAQTAARQQTVRAAMVLGASVEDDGRRLALKPLDDGGAIQSVSLAFPAALKIAGVDDAVEPAITADMFAEALRKSEAARSGKLPVVVSTRFVVDGEMRRDSALYDIGYRMSGGLIGHEVRMTGLSLVTRAPVAAAAKRRDRLWASRQPTISSGEKK